ncbi:MAG TPA: hypothetical protein VJN92_18760 [Candidatus Acidoferrum sp.]|nr:hypothetical protein [Candidatus Acidoferrum sp.]
MKLTAYLGVSLLLAMPAAMFAKAPTSKIIIEGGGLRKPIAITDPKVLSGFRIWSGPGTSGNESESLIIDWSQGPVLIPQEGLERYRVSFYVQFEPGRQSLVYLVSYVYDPLTHQGYVYLPGKGDDGYRLNVSTILRGVEGNWFRASKSWDNLARGLVAKKAGALKNP